MMHESHTTNDPSTIDMPKPTAAPLVLAVGIVLAAMGIATSLLFLIVGGILFVVGLGMWIGQLLPGRGHWREPRVEPSCVLCLSYPRRVESHDCGMACPAIACSFRRKFIRFPQVSRAASSVVWSCRCQRWPTEY